MPADAATDSTAPLPLRACNAVVIFTTAGIAPDLGGYTPDQLRQVVENFYRLGEFGLKLLDPPLGIGHDDDQDVLTALLSADPRLAPYLTAASLDGDDAPAAGWVTGLKLLPSEDSPDDFDLVADFKDIPAPIADLTDARAYKRVSVEIYDDFVDGQGNGYGNALRRVALCGFQPPVNKAMPDVPLTVAQYAEPRTLTNAGRTRTNPAARNTYTCFSEMRPMTKAQMLAALKGKFALSDAAANAMTDAEVAAIHKKFSEPTPPPASPPTVPPAQKMDEPPAAPTRDQMIAELQAAGQDAAQLASLSDVELTTLYLTWKGSQQVAPAAAMAEIKKYAEQVRRDANALQVELAKAKAATIEAQAASTQVKKYAEETASQHKAGKISAARLELVGANASGLAYCTPAEFDTVHREVLEGLDDLTVKTFSEGGKDVQRTPFANHIAKLKALPPKKAFAEKLPAEVLSPTDAAAHAEAERQKVRQYAEANKDGLAKFGESPDTMVKKFDKLREKNAALTAAEFTRGA